MWNAIAPGPGRPAAAAGLLLTLALGAAPALADASIKGKVVDVDGNPQVKATVVVEVVSVEGRAAGRLGSVKTRKDGSFTYPFVDPGTYRVRPEIEGYVVLQEKVVSLDSQRGLRMGNPDGTPQEFLINRDQTNLPEIPVAPHGSGAIVAGKTEVEVIVVKTEDHAEALSALQKGMAPGEAAPATPQEPVVSRKRDPVERGDEYYAGGDYAQAVVAYEEALAEDPGRAEAAYGLGKARLKQDDLAGAQQALRKAAESDPELPGVQFYLATIYHSLAQDQAAIAALEKERVNSPDSEEVLVNLGALYRDTNQPEKAQQILVQVIELNPENTDAYLALADVHNQLGNTKKAEEIYRMILDRNPGQADVIWYNIGVNAYNQNNREAAAQAFAKSIEADPKNADAHKMLGYTLVGLGKVSEAIPYFEKYLKLDPKGADAATISAVLASLKRG
jgi:tetratricopeptide (TPR) repeat protein